MKDSDPTQEVYINLHEVQERLIAGIVEHNTLHDNKFNQEMSDAQDEATTAMESMVSTNPTPKTKAEIVTILDEAKSQGHLSEIACRLMLGAL